MGTSLNRQGLRDNLRSKNNWMRN